MTKRWMKDETHEDGAIEHDEAAAVGSQAYAERCRELVAQPMRWLVSGAAGFIGSHITQRLLVLGQHVTCLDDFSTGFRSNLDQVRESITAEARGRLRLIEGDLRDPDACRRACRQVDLVSHQAALGSVPRSFADPERTHAVNVEGTRTLLAEAGAAGVERFVYASSSSVYGDNPDLPKVEERTGKPLSPYAESKRLVEELAQEAQAATGLETVGLRYFNVIGPRQRGDGAYAAVVPRWLRGMLRGERPHVHGDGSNSRDFTPVEDVVQAGILAARCRAACGVFNVASGRKTSLSELARMLWDGVRVATGTTADLRPEFGPSRAGDVAHSLADISRAVRVLGYQPSRTLERALCDLIAAQGLSADASCELQLPASDRLS
ncbi:MAG: UDP-N-acetylglucosamine 4-epimerase [Planctomycetota bacterium]|jgi:UDP-N-acetylglucosamine 4-epimerase